MTKTVEPTAGDILRHAAKLMEEWGLTKGQGLNHRTGAMCEGHVVMVAGGEITHEWRDDKWHSNRSWGEPPAWPSSHSASLILQQVGGGQMHNDLPGTTQTKAIERILLAADYADKRGW